MTREEAIKIVKDLYDKSLFLKKDKEAVRTLIPEVEESENEKIRKFFINFAEHYVFYNHEGFTKNDAIVWLEKQGDANEEYWRGYREGKQEVLDKYSELEKQVEQKPIDIESIKTEFYNAGYEDGKEYNQKPAWSEEDEKMLNDILMCGEHHCYLDAENIAWLKFLKDRIHSQPKKEWKQENIGDLTDFEIVMMHIGNSFFGKNAGLDPNDTNAIKEQANILLGLVAKQEWSEDDSIMIDNVLGTYKTLEDMLDLTTYQDKDILESMNFERDWIKSLKYRIQPKQEWSEEDELKIGDIRDAITLDDELEESYKEKLHDFLKSLRPQNTWKPSDEQMKALKVVVGLANSTLQRTLESLYNDLKKLREK